MSKHAAAKLPAQETDSDRREYYRVHLQTEIHLGSDSNFYTGFTDDISEGGLFVATYELRPKGTVIEVEFSLPDHETPMRVQGEVRWLREHNSHNDTHPGMGLRFVNLTPDAHKRIMSFVKKREPLFYDE